MEKEVNRCPNCGGKLTIYPRRKKKICEYCDSEFAMQEDEAEPAPKRSKAGSKGDGLLDPDRFEVLWNYRDLNSNEDSREGIKSFCETASERVTSEEIEKYLRNSLIPGADAAAEGINDARMAGIKRRILPDMDSNERIIVYVDTGIISKGKCGYVITTKRSFFADKKKHTYLMHEDLESIQLDTSLDSLDCYLNENKTLELMGMGLEYKLLGAVIALVCALAWEAKPERDAIRVVSSK